MSKIFSIYGTDIIDYGVDNIFETTKISNLKDNKNYKKFIGINFWNISAFFLFSDKRLYL